jgi:hypothetical protein
MINENDESFPISSAAAPRSATMWESTLEPAARLVCSERDVPLRQVRQALQPGSLSKSEPSLTVGLLNSSINATTVARASARAPHHIPRVTGR